VSLQDRMNQLFEDASQRRASETKSSDEVEQSDWYPAADVYEDDTEYTIAVDLPGIDRSALDISVEDNKLTIRGNRAALETVPHRGECPRGKFVRTFTVPASIEQNEIKADYKDGVLQVHLPRRAERKAQRVEIKIS
jgi:HSP20 family protein